MTVLPLFTSRSSMWTFAPYFAKDSAIAFPMPLEPTQDHFCEFLKKAIEIEETIGGKV
jgi:hypothetical protein